MFREAGLRVGASLLFGIPGETPSTIDHTFDRVERLLFEDKLQLVSPNLCTYHPGTALTQEDGMADKLDFVTVPTAEDPLMYFFEEASERHLSKMLTRGMMEQIKRRLGKLKNLNLNTVEDSLRGKRQN